MSAYGPVPHREGCPCLPATAARCYPCRVHPTEILTRDQWDVMNQLYGNSTWRGLDLAEGTEQALKVEDRRRAEGKVAAEDFQLGQEVIASWLDMWPGDLVKVVRHVQTLYNEDKGDDYCEPAYDDPECSAGTCSHIECDRQRHVERMKVAAASRLEIEVGVGHAILVDTEGVPSSIEVTAWSSSDLSVIRVDADTGAIQPGSPGVASIAARLADGNVVATLVTVEPPDIQITIEGA